MAGFKRYLFEKKSVIIAGFYLAVDLITKQKASNFCPALA